MGPADDASHQCAQQDLSRPHVPDEWPGDGHQGHLVLPQCTAHRRIVGRLGPKVLPAHHRVLHVRSHPADVDQLMVSMLRDVLFFPSTNAEIRHDQVVLRNDLNKWRLCRHIFRRFCLRGRRDDH
jgi:hypothetical protein